MKTNPGTPTRYPPLGIVIKYCLLQAPGLIVFAAALWAARQWLKVPDDLLGTLLIIWVAKDIILFPFLWRYYDTKQIPDLYEMVGRRGTALGDLTPEGYVRINGERWKAVNPNTDEFVAAGDAVYVKAIDGLRLTVGPNSIPAKASKGKGSTEN